MVIIYTGLVGLDEPRFEGLETNFWVGSEMVSVEENDALMLTFPEEEIKFTLRSMKIDTALGSDGFPVIFIKSSGV